jgi:hypothetical protein
LERSRTNVRRAHLAAAHYNPVVNGATNPVGAVPRPKPGTAHESGSNGAMILD